MEWTNLVRLLNLLLGGAMTSIRIFSYTLIISLPLGLAAALGRMSKKPWLRGPVKFYILVMRGTPLLLQIIFVYFAP